MTDPTNPNLDPSSEPPADREPEADVEMIKDLDVSQDDPDAIRGGSGHSHAGLYQ